MEVRKFAVVFVILFVVVTVYVILNPPAVDWEQGLPDHEAAAERRKELGLPSVQGEQ